MDKIALFIIGLLLGGLLYFLLFKKKVDATQEKTEILLQTKLLREKFEELEKNYNYQLDKLKNDVSREREILSQYVEQNEELVKKGKEKIDSELSLYRDNELFKIDNELAETQKWFEDYKAQQQAQIDVAMSDASARSLEMQHQVEELETHLAELKAQHDAINSTIMLRKMAQEQADFYRICLTDTDIADIKFLKSIEPKLVNKEVLWKMEYEAYIKKPLAEMLKRVLNNTSPSGIYSITFIPTGEMYIGRSTDVKKRWTEHVKSAYNLGTIAHSTLHTKMAREGIENFSFYLIEECDKTKLSEREKYYIDFFGTKNFLNEKDGG